MTTTSDQATKPPEDGRIVVRRDGDVFLIGIDRVPKYNGFSKAMLWDLAKAYSAFEHDLGLRCAVLYAEGPHFTAGLELDKVAQLLAEGRLFPKGDVDPVDLRPPLRTKPLVAAVQGICFTLGIELMLAADMVVAAEDCRFAQLEVRRGIMANQGATIRMPQRAGLGNALRYLLTGDEFDARTALRLGLVQEVVVPGQQLQRALELARTIADQAPLAVAATRANATQAITESTSAAAAELDPIQEHLFRTDDVAEGLRSFIERRPAVFKGQ